MMIEEVSLDDGRSVSRNVASLNILVHDVTNILDKFICISLFPSKVKNLVLHLAKILPYKILLHLVYKYIIHLLEL